MSDFFRKTHCDRCGKKLKSRICSMYNTDCICMECKDAEMKREDYTEAVAAEIAAVRLGDYNFSGIGLGE